MLLETDHKALQPLVWREKGESPVDPALGESRPQRFLDRYMQLMAEIFGVPMAAVSLINKDHQWLTSAFGIDVCEKSVQDFFCEHALPLDVLEVPDTQKDDLFCGSCAVIGHPTVRFYLGVVLHGPGGQPIGAFCIMDIKPRVMTRLERTWLVIFGRQIAELINQERPRFAAFVPRGGTLHRNILISAPGSPLADDSLARLVSLSEKGGGYLAVLHMRLNRVEEIYLHNGHLARNAILHCLAERLTATDSRVLAAHYPSMGRFGAVIPVRSVHDLFGIITLVVAKLSRPMTIEGLMIYPDIDVRVSLASLEGATFDNLLERAEAALTGPISHTGIRVISY